MDESEVLKFEQPVRQLRLSEAIRIGARLRPQCTSGAYFEDGKSCAFGAASEALRGDMDGFSANKLHDSSWSASMAYMKVYRHPIALDNDAGVPREVIADRLEALGF